GTDITFDLGGDWYVMVDVVSSKANPDAADAAVNPVAAMARYRGKTRTSSSCSGLPAVPISPLTSAETGM
ncbi:hypothetical protein, partial [Enterococcus faecium]|uniref:hypothetical protein n=1 Tax=Enterococcus faecium TaxID=1352 RepID=UPI001C545E2F